MIQLKNVHKNFGPKRVLDGFTLDVPEGEESRPPHRQTPGSAVSALFSCA